MSPPVSPGFGCATEVVVPPSFPQFDVLLFALEGLEISPNNIKSKFNIVLKI